MYEHSYAHMEAEESKLGYVSSFFYNLSVSFGFFIINVCFSRARRICISKLFNNGMSKNILRKSKAKGVERRPFIQAFLPGLAPVPFKIL